MSDELEPVEGVVLDQPITSQSEARELVDRALALMREGQGALLEGHRLLEVAERREAWRALGFDSWQECLADGVSRIFNVSIEQSQRMQLVVRMRQQSLMGTTEMAEAVGVHPATVNRDLQKARDTGLLDEEPPKVLGRDGIARGTRRTKPRPDLRKSWLNAVDDLGRRARTLEALRGDDRYRQRLGDLAGSLGDLQRAHAVLTQILADLEPLHSQPTPLANEGP